MAKLKVIREKRFVGMAIRFSVLVDGKKIGDLKNGVTLSCEVGSGKHVLKITSLEKDLVQEINVDESCNGIEVSVSLGIGILAARPRIDKVKYI